MIYLYNNATVTFIQRARQEARHILEKEAGLKVARERFLLGALYVPFSMVVFEGRKEFGYCDPRMFQIGLNKALMWQAKSEVLRDVLRHELAHLMTHVLYPGANAHGPEFREVCQRFFGGREIARASMLLEQENQKLEGELEWEKMQVRLKKLLSLATSNNQHEAQLAAAKANRLILEYNLGKIRSQSEDGVPETFARRVLEGKRTNGVHRAIAEILKGFLVHPVFNNGKGWFYLEAIGDRANVEFAAYVAAYLESELERLWARELLEEKGRGGPKPHKNSFMAGVAQGYSRKIRETQDEVLASPDLRSDLPVRSAWAMIKERLDDQVALVHPRLGGLRSRAQQDRQWLARGERAGRSLNIHRPLTSSGGTFLLGDR